MTTVETGEMSKIVKEKACEVEWKVNSYFVLEKDLMCVFSCDFSFEGETWYLGMWPNGLRNKDTSRYIDLFLFRRSAGLPIKIEFCLSLKTVNGRKDFERIETRDFEDLSSQHFIHRFTSKYELRRRRNEFENSGFLTFVCTLKIINSTESKNKYYLYEREMGMKYRMEFLTRI